MIKKLFKGKTMSLYSAKGYYFYKFQLNNKTGTHSIILFGSSIPFGFILE